ncbi:MAG TPA: hypothetical protein VE912_02825 [Bacteroidales bacterium]|nr:hypothetical protein [Bacteroidales bacterium]
MKAFIQNLGVIFILAGLVILAVNQLNDMNSNKLLGISGGVILLGLIVYIFTNKYVSE